MNPYSFIPFSSFLANIVLSAIVLALNPRSKTNRAYSLFASGFSMWAFLNFMEWNFHSPMMLLIFKHIEPVMWLPSTYLVLNFIYVLTKRKRGVFFWLITVIDLLWAAFGALTGGLVIDFKHAYWGELAIVSNLYYLAILTTVIPCAIMGIWILINASLSAQDSQNRQQLMYLSIGTILMFILVFMESVFRTSILKMDSVPFLGSFFLIIQSAFVFFAIIRFRFLNIDVRDAAREIFSQVQDGVIILDPNQLIVEINNSAQIFFGITSTTQVKSLDLLFGQNYRFNENYTSREIIYTNNGEKKIAHLSQSGFFERGRFIGKVVIIRDITQRREEERKRVQLEIEVQQSHTSHLDALGRLAGGIAHDFNNMLSGVTGYATLLQLRMDSADKKLLSYIDKIIQSAQRAADLTKKLLVFAHKNISEMVTFAINDAIGDTVTLLKHTIDKRITISTDFQATTFLLRGDRTQVHNMLLYMAINACDAMPEGGSLRFITKNKEIDDAEVKKYNKEAQGGIYIIIDVEDTGTGMTDEIKAKIFDPFFTTKQSTMSSGLGLANAYGIARAHHGFIVVDTEIGKGSTFHVYLPISVNESVVEIDNGKGIEYGTGNILLVDDEEDIRISTTDILTTIGYKVFSCSNGEEAVNWFRQNNNKVDLVLLDVMMPKMTGDKCAEALREINPSLKIIFVSGYSSTLSNEKLESLRITYGPIALVQKPFTIDHLSKIIKQTLDS